MDVLLFSDPHLSGTDAEIVGQKTDSRLLRCLTNARSRLPGAVHTIFAGDLTDEGAAEGYVALREMLADWHTPVTFLMGNEDHRGRFRDQFPDVSCLPDGGVQTVLRFGDHAVFCLDTLDPDADPRHSGWLGPARLDWVQAQLASCDARHKTVILHHPPLPLDLPFFDRIMLRDGGDLLAILHRHDVRLCISGHVHRRCVVQDGGLELVTLDSTGFGLRLGPGETDIAPEPKHRPGYAVLRLSDEGPSVLPMS